MKSFLKYVLAEMTAGRLPKQDALRVLLDLRRETSSSAVLHPLVHRNTSTLEGQRYSTKVEGEEYYVRDHVVQGRRVVPAAAQLELAREAVAQALQVGGEGVELQDVVFAKPVVVGAGGVELHIELQEREDGRIGYELYSEEDSPVGEAAEVTAEVVRQVHGRGNAVVGQTARPQALDVQALRARAKHSEEGPQCYAAFERLGLAYGPAMRGLQQLSVAEEEGVRQVLARLALPDQAGRDGGYVLHPSLVDAALQACMGLQLGQTEQEPRLELPFAVERVQSWQAVPERCWVHVSVSAQPEGGTRQAKLELSLADDQGQVCARLQGFSSRPLSGGLLDRRPPSPTSSLIARPSSAAPIGALSLVPTWEPLRPAARPAWPEADQTILILADEPGPRHQLQTAYPQARVLALDPAQPLQEQLQAGPVPQHIFWVLPSEQDLPLDGPQLIQAQQRGVLRGVELLRALHHVVGERQPLGLTVCTMRTQQPGARHPCAPAHAGVHGLLGVAAKEYPRWQIRLLDLDPEDDHSLPLPELLQLPPQANGNAWVHRLGQWHQPRLIPARLDPATPVPYRTGGVYVILGGAGGLGEAFSEHLIRQHQAQVIWIGRRAADADLQARCRRLGQYGPEPQYLSADATDLQALQAAKDRIVQQHGAIHGLVHATIVLKDQTLARQAGEDFQAALAAKVDTSVNLARVFADSVSDFVVYFSSAQSWLKVHGQANYAAGCVFADAHAQALRAQWRCPVKVINWGYWGSVGIVAQDETRQRMAKLGMDSIEPGEAWQAIEQLLSTPIGQLGFIKTLRPEIAQALGVDGGQQLQMAAGDPLAPATPATPDSPLSPPDSTRPLPLTPRDEQRLQALERQLAGQLYGHLQTLGLLQPGQPVELRHGLTAWKQRIGLPALYDRWLQQSLHILQAQGWIRLQDGHLHAQGEPALLQQLHQDWQHSCAHAAQEPHWQAQIELLHAMLGALPAILQGRQSAPQAMFPGASMRLVENVYKNNRIADHFNDVLADSLIHHLRQRLQRDPQARLRLLEIGAGTGGTSARLFDVLGPYAHHIERYDYTDISKAFLLHAREHYEARAPYLKTQLFNVERPLQGQGLQPGSYDVVIATNVLHATREMARTLDNAKALLRRQGVLLLNEIAGTSVFAHLSFGLLEGWWLYDDPELRTPGSPALSPQAWQAVLRRAGFAPIAYPAQAAHRFGQQVIVAVSDGVVRQAHEVPAAAPAAASTAVATTALAATAPTGPAGLREPTEAYLKTLVAQTLKMTVGELDAHEPWTTYGVDSILGMQVTDALGRVFDGVDSTLLFEHTSIHALAQHLIDSQPATVLRVLGPQQVQAQPDATSAVEPAAVQSGRSRRRTRTDAHVPSRTDTGPTPRQTPLDIAIVGLSGRYPEAAHIDQYWDNLLQGRNCIREIPTERWDWRRYHSPDKAHTSWGRSYSRWGGFIDGVDRFDPLFFGIAPREAERMIPQERLFLEEAYTCMQDAGYTPATLSASRRVGVFVGIMNSHYGSAPSYWSVANRVSYLFGFTGPSLAVDTACSASLTAIHLACQSVASGQVECAIAGGVNLITDPVQYMGLSAMTMLSSGDQCRAFGADADGFVDAEGVGAVLLKPLRQAQADGDRIYGVIKASAVNHGGKTNGYTVPNPKAQGEVIAQALEESGLPAGAIGYIEAHGTGTALGDPIEIAGLVRALGEPGQGRGTCAIGSAKSNIGHCESAAGIAGLTKVLLQMKHKTLVKSLHSEELNPHIDFGKTVLRVQQEVQAWEKAKVKRGDGQEVEYPRTAGISSFGAGGANAHLIVQEYEEGEGEAHEAAEPSALQPVVVVVSARNEERLKEQVRRLLEVLEKAPPALADVAYTLQVGREAMDSRLACVVWELGQLREQLQGYLQGQERIERAYRGEARKGREALGALATDEDMQGTLRAWVGKGKVERLAEAWSQGLAVGWEALYAPLGPRPRPRRIALPGYPFARERYWVPEAPRARPQQAAVLHPLVHRNTSTLEGQRYSTKVEGEEYYVRDHVVQGRRVVPAAAQLELAREAVAQALQVGGEGVELQDVVFAKPVVVGAGGVELHIELQEREDGRIGYELYSEEDSPVGEAAEVTAEVVRQVHGRGNAVVGQTARPQALDVQALRARAKHSEEGPQCYAAFERLGLAYGPAMRGLQQLSVAEEEGVRQVLARLALPDQAGRDGGYVLHPSLVDAALQACMGLQLGQTEQEPRLELPFAVERVQSWQAVPERCWVHVSVSAQPEGGTRQAKLELSLADDQGQVCARLQGFSSRPLSGGLMAAPVATPMAASAEIRTVLMTPQWRVLEPSPSGQAQPMRGRHHIVLCEVGCGVEGEVEGEAQGKFEAALSAALPQAQVHRLQDVPGELHERYTQHGVQLLRQVQALLQACAEDDELVLQLLVPAQGEAAVLRGLGGLLKSASQEHPRLITQVIGMEEEIGIEEVIRGEGGLGALSAQLLAQSQRGSCELRYQRGQVWQLQYEAGQATPPVASPWKPQGVYLITGGAGGLGLIFAQAIATRAPGARLVLSGRSGADEDKQAALDVLKSLGAQAEYRVLDVSDEAQVQALVQALVHKHGRLDGVLHSAGVLRDGWLHQKGEAALREVFAAKVSGLVHLDRATAEVQLEHFIVFGSSAGVLGNVGQADYAAANAFMDAYAQERAERVKRGERAGSTLSVDWPLWGQGGMQMDEAARRRLWQGAGLAPLDSEAGVQALEQALVLASARGVAQVAVFAGDAQRIVRGVQQRLHGNTPQRTVADPTPVSAGNEPQAGGDTAALKHQTEQYLTGLLSRALKLAPHRIDPQAPLEQYGIDSVMVMDLGQALDSVFGALPKTLFFEYQSIQALAEYFLQRHRPALLRLLGRDRPQGPVPAASAHQALPAPALAPRRRRARPHAQLPSRTDTGPTPRQTPLDIAIVGLSGRYPQATDLGQYWDNLLQGVDCIREIPAERWDHTRYFDPRRGQLGKSYSKWGGFIDGVDQFDPLFFNISPREASAIDPQERLFLQCVYHTLEDAGYTRERLVRSGPREQARVGVFVGVMYEEYQLYGAQAQALGEGVALTGNPASIANRVSYWCNFVGPSLAVDTMCSSSLTAIHLACQSVASGECEAAIAGGVNLSLHPNKYLLLAQGQFSSSEGLCRSFGQGGDGYVPGEGVGAVLLKPLRQAQADGDRIYGVIKASAVNHGGKTNGYTVPNPKAQGEVIAQALEESGLPAGAIGYIEAHGTGTALGDPIEIAGLVRALGEPGQGRGTCAIGSAKSNIGHCESAAGIAGLTKVLLQMKHKTLVKSLHSEELNPHIDFGKTVLRVQQEVQAWEKAKVKRGDGQEVEYPRTAGISSFGAGGANAHLIVQEYEEGEGEAHEAAEPSALQPVVVVVSARNEERLKEQVRRLLEVLEKAPPALADVAYTLQVGREAMDSRLACVVWELGQLREQLQGYLQGQERIERAYRGEARKGREALGALATDEDMQGTLRAWVGKGKVERLAEAWSQGLAVGWEALYAPLGPRPRPRRIALPGYPFARERYWVPEAPRARPQQAAVLHPLVHRNTSTLEGQRYSTKVEGEEYYVRDHVVQGRRVVPAAAQLELAREAVAQALQVGGEGVELQDVVFAKPVVVGAGGVELHIELQEREDGRIGYELYSEEDSPVGEAAEVTAEVVRQVHGRGNAVVGQTARPQALDVQALRARAKHSEEGPQCYAAFERLGLAYGPAMRGLQQLSVAEEEGVRQVLARLALPDQAGRDGGYVLHPSLVDAALQACMGLQLGQTEQEPRLELPFAVERVQSWQAVPERCWVHVSVSAQPEGGTRQAKLELSLADDQGQVCARLQGFSSRPLSGGLMAAPVATPMAASAEIRTVLMTPQWRVLEPSPSGQAQPMRGRHHIVLCEVGCGVEGEVEGEAQGKFEAALSAALPQAQVHRLQDVPGELHERYTQHGVQLLRQVQALLQACAEDDELVLQLLVPAQGEAAVLRGLGGLLKSASQEHPRLITQVIGMEEEIGIEEVIRGEGGLGALSAQLLAQSQRGSCELRYQRGQVWQLQYEAGQATPPVASPWKPQGVYLITGGAGGLGLIFAQAIATRAPGARLVLSGRSGADEDKQAALDVLKSLGAQAEYRVLDVSDEAQVQALVQALVHKHGRLDGVLHSAGVLRDGWLHQKGEAALREVFAAKVSGLVHLDRATAEVQLEHFIVFGSSAGVLGNVGQADYAAANAFMDAYAQERAERVKRGERAGSTLSVDWPLWGQGGMQMDEAARRRLWQGAGLAPLDSEAGVQALEQALVLASARGVAQVAVFAGDAQRIVRGVQQRLHGNTPQRTVADPTPVSAGNEPQARLLQDRVRAALVNTISAILKINPGELDTEAELGEFGFDSITLTALGNELNQKYGLELMPTVFFEHPSIGALAAHLATRHAAVLWRHFGTPAAQTPAVQQVQQEQAPSPAEPTRRRRRGTARPEIVPQEAQPEDEPIAVIGLSGCFPQAADVNALWDNLLAGRDCIGEIPDSRWDWERLYGPSHEANKTPVKRAGVIDEIDQFDPLFFGISPREAEAMDPQQRLLMTHVWKVIEDAGYSPQSLWGSDTGLFIGTGVSGYNTLRREAGEAVEGYSAPAMVPSVGPNRMSYLLNLHGPSEPIETACSSALVAVHRALLSMRAGQCQMAIVGGVNTLVSPEPHISFSKAGMLCEDGKCKTFSAQANGYVRGEGVGMVMLKKLSAAQRDGDHIYGLIRGSAQNHGGRANSLTAPNPRAQAELIKAALRQAKVPVHSLGYIEAHGTGTPLGDPIEVQGLSLAFQELAQEQGQGKQGQGKQDQEGLRPGSCGLGSVKTNIGHLELAAGVAGLIKVLLQMKHKTLVKSLHSEELNPYLQLEGGPFYVVQENREWRAPVDAQGREQPRRAGVSSFGFGGVNAHVVLEEYVAPAQEGLQEPEGQGAAVVVLSARSEDRLRAQAQRLVQALEDGSTRRLRDVAYTLQVGREAMEVRLACVVSTQEQLCDKLRRYVQGQPGIEGLYTGEVRRHKEALAVFGADEDMGRLIQAWQAKGKLDKLAELWCKGQSLHWASLYDEYPTPRRISLPSYAFASERYWVAQPAAMRRQPAHHLASFEFTTGAVPASAPAPERRPDTRALLDELFDRMGSEASGVDAVVDIARRTLGVTRPQAGLPVDQRVRDSLMNRLDGDLAGLESGLAASRQSLDF